MYSIVIIVTVSILYITNVSKFLDWIYYIRNCINFFRYKAIVKIVNGIAVFMHFLGIRYILYINVHKYVHIPFYGK